MPSSNSVHLWLRAETKENEQRTHLTPQKCRELLQSGFQVTVELSKQRVFEDEEYEKIQGINIVPEGSWPDAPKDAYILGIKELPHSDEPITQQHVYFAHAYKYQSGWANLLHRFTKGGGSVLDVEYLTDENGRRTVVAFPHMAGFTGMALGILSWCHKLLHPKSSMPGVKPFSSEQLLVNHVKKQMEKVSEIKGIAELFPRIIIIGALGRCGKGALDMAIKVGIPVSHLAKWDMNETKKGGPFKEILDYDIFVNCICLTKKIPPFLTRDMLDTNERSLTVVVDVSCDATSPYNPLPIYNSCTSFNDPSAPVKLGSCTKPLEIVAVDHLPSLLPRESSISFADAMEPHLKNLVQSNGCPVWSRTQTIFNQKAVEAEENIKKKTNAFLMLCLCT